MSVIAVALKDGRGAIACDTRLTLSSISMTLPVVNGVKYWQHDNGFIGSVGSCGWDADIELLANSKKSKKFFNSTTELEVYKYWSSFVSGKNMADCPSVVMLNAYGIFYMVGSCVKKVAPFMAIGSGMGYALGYMSAEYESMDVTELVKNAVLTSIKFDTNCGSPVVVNSMLVKGVNKCSKC